MLVKNKFFWIITLLFLLVALALVWLIYPPLMRQLQDNRSQLAALDATLSQEKQYAELVKTLTSQNEQVLSLYQSAKVALPVTTSGEILLLQIDGLLHSINLSSASVTAPFAAAVPAAAPAPADTSGVKPSSQSGTSPTTSTPIVKSNDQAASMVTITADTDFGTLKTLIEKLRHLARWNKITSISVTVSTKMTVVITTQIFTKADAAKGFAGTDPQFLTKATQLFSSFTSYATTPDATKEGNYGRKDPFAGL